MMSQCKVIDNHSIHYTIKMPSYEISYTLPTLEERISKEIYSPEPINYSKEAREPQNYNNRHSIQRPTISVRKDLLRGEPNVKSKLMRKERSGIKENEEEMSKNSDLLPPREAIIKRSTSKHNYPINGKRQRYNEDINNSGRAPKRKKILETEKLINPGADNNLKILEDRISKDCEWSLKQDMHGNYPLHNAVLQCNPRLISRYSSVLVAMKSSLDLMNFMGQTPLHIAILLGQCHAVESFLRMGADPAVADASGNTSYHLAVLKKDSKVLKELLKRSLKKDGVDQLNDDGASPLHLAVISKMEQLVKMLLAFGAHPDGQNGKNGKTPVQVSAELDSFEISKLLISYGATPPISNNSSYGGTISSTASQNKMLSKKNHPGQDLLEQYYNQLL